ATHRRLAARDAELEVLHSGMENELVEQRHERRTLDDEAQLVNEELHSLQSRKTNLPRRSLDLRERMVNDLGIDADDLPFAGELLQVSDDTRDWEGAAERVLRNFAMSMLVPDRHYEAVAGWINEHHLGARIVYYRVPARPAQEAPPERRGATPLLV